MSTLEDLRKNLKFFAEFDYDSVEEVPPLPAEITSMFDGDDSFGHMELCVALYWYGVDYHGGQYTAEYACMSVLDYKPGAGENGPEEGSTAKDIYDMLAAGEVELLSVVKAIVEYRDREAAKEEE